MLKFDREAFILLLNDLSGRVWCIIKMNTLVKGNWSDNWNFLPFFQLFFTFFITPLSISFSFSNSWILSLSFFWKWSRSDVSVFCLASLVFPLDCGFICKNHNVHKVVGKWLQACCYDVIRNKTTLWSPLLFLNNNVHSSSCHTSKADCSVVCTGGRHSPFLIWENIKCAIISCCSLIHGGSSVWVTIRIVSRGYLKQKHHQS